MSPAKSRPRAKAKPTLRDVAQALGVSVATVSNAYNRPDQLSAELRDRILTTARDMGYPGPNPLARSLRRGKTGVIALVYDAPLEYAFADPAASLFLGSLAATIQTQGLNLLLLACPDSTQPVQTASVDGFIVYCAAEGSPLLRAVRLGLRRLLTLPGPVPTPAPRPRPLILSCPAVLVSRIRPGTVDTRGPPLALPA